MSVFLFILGIIVACFVVRFLDSKDEEMLPGKAMFVAAILVFIYILMIDPLVCEIAPTFCCNEN